MTAPMVDADDRRDPGDPWAIEADFRDLALATTRLSEDVGARLEQDTDAAAACILLLDLREARGKLQELEAAVEATAAQRMSGKELRFPGYVAERRGGRRPTNWQHDELAWALLSDLIVNPDTGEVDPLLSVVIDTAREKLLTAASVTWRTTKLREYGIDPTEFCEYVDSRRTVQVRRDTEDAPS